MTGRELLDEHVRRFNAAVRSGDFAPMLELFEEDASLEFVGVSAGPFRGKQAIAEAYRAQPPDDEIEILAVNETNCAIVARYAWLRDRGKAAGDMRLTCRGGRIERLVVAFDAVTTI